MHLEGTNGVAVTAASEQLLYGKLGISLRMGASRYTLWNSACRTSNPTTNMSTIFPPPKSSSRPDEVEKSMYCPAGFLKDSKGRDVMYRRHQHAVASRKHGWAHGVCLSI